MSRSLADLVALYMVLRWLAAVLELLGPVAVGPRGAGTMAPVLAMSDENVKLLLEFLLGLCVLAGQVLTALLQRRSAKATSAKVETVQAALEDNTARTDAVKATVQAATAGTASMLQGLKETVVSTHALVNDRHGAALRLAAEALREVANLKQTPESLEAAAAAEWDSARHDAQQARVDESQDREAARQADRDLARAQAQERDRLRMPGKLGEGGQP